MQKKIIALAVAGLMSGAAFAQTNVTVYGAADVTFDNVKATGASNLLVDIGTGPGDVPTTYTNLNQPARNRVSANSSILGFKGTEDLGGGLKAVFQFEGSVANDSAGGFSFVRDSFVGLAGGFGTVAAGILTGPTRGLGAAMDPFLGATGITSNTGLIGKLGGATLVGVNPYYTFPATAGNDNTIANEQAAMGAFGYCATSGTCASLFDTRWNNAIAYISPNMAGLTVTAAYVANENKTRADVSNKLNTWGYDLGLRYENGPIMAGLTQNQAKVGDNAGIKATDTRLAAKYNFGAGTVGLLFDRVKVDIGGDSMRRNAWFIPVTFNVTAAGKIVAQYGQAGDVTDSGGNTGAKMFALGYEHSLSKRTTVKAVWSQISNEADAAYDFGVNSVGGILPGADPKGFQVGVRHSF
ncbi:MAG: porin [Rhodocyclaceae bacterium]|nr:porin [Rhodocyclaceae bacterium]